MAVLISLASVLPAAPAYAHAKLMSSSPAAGQAVSAPGAVTLDFDDVVQPPPGAIRVSGPRGDVAVRVAQPNDKTLVGGLPKALAKGRYTVRWRIVADDGHTESASFSFAVRPGAGRASAAAAMPARGPGGSSRGGGTAGVVLTLVLSIVTIVALSVALVRLGRERTRV